MTWFWFLRGDRMCTQALSVFEEKWITGAPRLPLAESSKSKLFLHNCVFQRKPIVKRPFRNDVKFYKNINYYWDSLWLAEMFDFLYIYYQTHEELPQLSVMHCKPQCKHEKVSQRTVSWIVENHKSPPKNLKVLGITKRFLGEPSRFKFFHSTNGSSKILCVPGFSEEQLRRPLCSSKNQFVTYSMSLWEPLGSSDHF